VPDAARFGLASAPSDLALVGGGLSGTLALLSLADEMERRAGRPRRVVLVDRRGDFGGGVPYGAHTHPAHLLNEDVATMDVRGFRNWVVRCRAADDAAALDAAFVPRRVFGAFLRERLDATLRRVDRGGVLRVERVAAEAVSVQRRADGVLELGLRGAAPLRAHILLIAVGSLPPDRGPDLPPDSGWVRDPYARGFDALRGTLLEALRRGGDARPRRLLVLGSNASAMELLFSIAIDPALAAAVQQVLVLSTGTLPDARPSARPRAFAPLCLRSLRGARHPTARALWHAAQSDVARARAAGDTSLDYASPLGDELRAILAAMSLEERRRFAAYYGRRCTALRYHTPPAYADAAARLRSTSALETRCVRVESVDAERSAKGRLVVRISQGGRRGALCGDAVVDCRGAGSLARSQLPLLRSLLDPAQGEARSNPSGLGIEVSPELEASPGVFVLGPLLAGHASEQLTLWNLDSAPRIDPLAARLAATLAARWARV
jgi:uncharacterized NAD(P)/FAD-binding protein YdhS